MNQLRVVMNIQKSLMRARGIAMFNSKKDECILEKNRLISQFSIKIVKILSFVLRNE